MKRQQAFEGKAPMLKGALHCHTTRSDGRLSPEEVIRLHYEKGYDFLAITDHRCYNLKSYAQEIPLTILPGMEFDNLFDLDTMGYRCFHTVCLGCAGDDGNGFEQDQYFERGTAKDQYEYQDYLDDFHAKGNLTILCHPEWSNTPARFFEEQKGNFAMEIYNAGAALDYDTDLDAPYWDEILGQGKVLYGVAADDGHKLYHYGNGWVMVQAQNNVQSILEALADGKFYSSCGPEIYDFYVKDGIAVVECSPASKIRFHNCKLPPRIFRSEKEDLTRAELDLKGDYAYVRAVVVDNCGKYAWTNPIFL